VRYQPFTHNASLGFPNFAFRINFTFPNVMYRLSLFQDRAAVSLWISVLEVLGLNLRRITAYRKTCFCDLPHSIRANYETTPLNMVRLLPYKSLECFWFLFHSTLYNLRRSRDYPVSIAIDYRLDNRMIGVQFPAGDGNFSFRHHVQTGSGAHPASYPMGTGGSFPGGKAGGA
jgi:hypothetical protein